MIERSPSRAADEAAILAAVPRWQDAVQAYDAAVGARLGLGASERHALAFLAAGPRSGREIAAETRLSPAAVTALVDRLAARGLVERRGDPGDRRRVMVALTPAAERLAAAYYGGLAAEGAALLAAMSDAEVAAVRRFVEAALAAQVRALDGLAPAAERGPSR